MSFTIFLYETTPFFQRGYNDIFPKGLPILLVQKWHFFELFFLGNIGHKNGFYDILEGKNAFLGYKKKSLKSRKIHIFPKGLTHGFGPIMAIFPTFLLLGIIR